MPTDPAELNRRLAALQARFAARLRQDAAELTELAGRLSTDGPGSMEALRRIRSLAHGLHGAAAAFNQPRIGQASAALEAKAEAALGSGAAPPCPEDADALRAEIGLIRSLLPHAGAA